MVEKELHITIEINRRHWRSICIVGLGRWFIEGKGEKPMKHRQVKQLKAEIKRLKLALRVSGGKKKNNCPMCAGVSDESLDQMMEKARRCK